MGSFELCLCKRLTGLPCPGCGLTRAFLAFFHLDLKRALFYHPLFWMVPIVVLIFLLQKKSAICRKLCHSKLFLGGVIVLFVGVYCYRMWLYFPHTPPFDYNTQSVWGQFWQAIHS